MIGVKSHTSKGSHSKGGRTIRQLLGTWSPQRLYHANNDQYGCNDAASQYTLIKAAFIAQIDLAHAQPQQSLCNSRLREHQKRGSGDDVPAGLAGDSMSMHEAGPGVHIRPHFQEAHAGHDSPDLSSRSYLAPRVCKLVAEHQRWLHTGQQHVACSRVDLHVLITTMLLGKRDRAVVAAVRPESGSSPFLQSRQSLA